MIGPEGNRNISRVRVPCMSANKAKVCLIGRTLGSLFFVFGGQTMHLRNKLIFSLDFATLVGRRFRPFCLFPNIHFPCRGKDIAYCKMVNPNVNHVNHAMRIFFQRKR